MKKLLCVFIALIMVFSSFAVYADTETLFAAFENAPLSASTRTEMTITLNKPFDFINQLISEEDMYDMPVDIQMLAESACSITESIDMEYSISEDMKQMKYAASTEINMPLEFSEDFKADIWAQIGIWLDMDLTDESAPKLEVIYKVPFSNKYLVLDYADLIEQDEYSAQQLIEYMDNYTSKDMVDELKSFYKETVLENMTIKETSTNREYVLTADDAGFKKIIKSAAEKMYDIIMEALGVQEEIDNEEYRYQFEEYLSVFENFQILGKDGFKIRVSLKNKQLSISDVSMHVNCNLYDAVTEFGGDMSNYDREMWWLDFTINVKTAYDKVNQKLDITFPELTEENSRKMFDSDYDYIPMYERIYIDTTSEIIPDSNGNFSIPLEDAMSGCYIAKKYYSVQDGKITINCPENDKYSFTTAEMNVGSDVLTVDGVETKLYTSVAALEDGSVMIPIDAVVAITGYELSDFYQYNIDDGKFNTNVVLVRPNPDYEEDDDYDYISPWIYLYEDGAPVVNNDELYIPLKNTMLELGITEENITAADGKIIVTNDNPEIPEFTEIKFTEFSNVVYVDSVAVTLANPVTEINGKAYFPSQLLESINCTVESVTYYFEDAPNYGIDIRRDLLDYDDYNWVDTYSEYNYIYISDEGKPLIIDGEYYLPLWPLMGELMVSGDDILEIDNTVSVISAHPSTGFKAMVINGTSVTMDDKQFTLTKPMIDIEGKKYLPAQFVPTVLGGTITGISISYDEDYQVYTISADVPNPAYVAEEE